VFVLLKEKLFSGGISTLKYLQVFHVGGVGESCLSLNPSSSTNMHNANRKIYGTEYKQSNDFLKAKKSP